MIGTRARTSYIALAWIAAACASTGRNPVLDSYPAGVTGRTSVFYYDVHGRTVEELRADMRRLGPKIGGSSFVGETRSPMRWRWQTEANGPSMCSIRDVTVEVNAEITLPRWTPPPDTEPGLLAEWKRFITALEVHEAGHKDISAKAAKEIIRGLRGMSDSCTQLGIRANNVASQIVTHASEEQKAYDATTRHGLTQGTGFAPSRRGGAERADSMTLLVGPRVGTLRGMLQVPVERVWAELPKAYASVGLEVNAVDSASHALGDSMTVRSQLGGMSVSAVVDCPGLATGVSADSVGVSVFVTSRLEPSETGGSVLVNTVQSIARPPGALAVACRSRAVIERRIFEAVLTQLVR